MAGRRASSPRHGPRLRWSSGLRRPPPSCGRSRPTSPGGMAAGRGEAGPSGRSGTRSGTRPGAALRAVRYPRPGLPPRPTSRRPRRRDGGRPSPRRPSSRSRRPRRRSKPRTTARISPNLLAAGWHRRRGRAVAFGAIGSDDMDGHLLDDVPHVPAPVPARLGRLDLAVTARGPDLEAMLAP